MVLADNDRLKALSMISTLVLASYGGYILIRTGIVLNRIIWEVCVG
jgi:hypothetical protein